MNNGKNAMKEELKRLYRLNPDLAKRAARVLGYKIKADSVDYDDLPDDIQKTLKSIGWRENDIAFIKSLEPIGSYFIKYHTAKSVFLTRNDLKILFKNSRFENVTGSKDVFALFFKEK